MKKIVLSISITTMFALFIIPLPGISQEWGGTNPVTFWDHWSINANAGVTSFYGDLSYYDGDFAGKLSNESGAAFGMLITKHFNNKFGVSGQLLFGNLKGADKNNISFTADMIEYNLQARLDFIRLILPKRNPKFGLEGFVGIGHMWFNTVQYEYDEGTPKTKSHDSSVPEFVYFFGGSLHYHFVERFAITTSLSIRQVQNDKLDNLVKNDNNDYYSYLSVGITYYIESFLSRPLKNKARLAHSNTILR